MPYRKILVNLLAAFVVFPVFLTIRHWKNIVTGNYRYFDTYYENLADYIDVIVIRPPAYLVVPFFALIFIFLPFQLLKDYYFKQKRKLTIIKKVLALSIITMGWLVLLGFATNILVWPLYKSFLFLIYAFPFGVLFALLLYVLIDRYEERLPKNMI